MPYSLQYVHLRVTAQEIFILACIVIHLAFFFFAYPGTFINVLMLCLGACVTEPNEQRTMGTLAASKRIVLNSDHICAKSCLVSRILLFPLIQLWMEQNVRSVPKIVVFLCCKYYFSIVSSRFNLQSTSKYLSNKNIVNSCCVYGCTNGYNSILKFNFIYKFHFFIGMHFIMI